MWVQTGLPNVYYGKRVDYVVTTCSAIACLERPRSLLLQSHDFDEREYPDAADQIREVLIHGHYLSQKDIEACLNFDLTSMADQPAFNSTQALHEETQSLHVADDGNDSE